MLNGRCLAVAPILLGLILAGCGGTDAAQPASPLATASASPSTAFASVQRSEGGQVTVEVTWDGPRAGAAFEVKLDTHSVDLDALDLADAVLTNDQGERLAAVPWPAAKGGHHRQGPLTFAGDAATFLADARWVELTLTGIGGLRERVLRWDVPA